MRVVGALLLAVFVLTPAAPAFGGGFDWIGRIEMDAEGLSSPRSEDRLRAVKRLGKYSTAFTKPMLLRVIKDPDPMVRAAAGRILARGRGDEVKGIANEWLSSPTVELRRAGADMLGTLGDTTTIPSLVRSLTDLDDVVRLRVVAALAKIGTHRAVVPLVGRLEDPKPGVRAATIAALADLHDKRAVVPLVGLFNDSSTEVRVAAISAVGSLGDVSAVPALVRLLEDPLDPVRAASASALGLLAGERATSALLKHLQEGTTTFRSKAIFALGQIVARHPGSAQAEKIMPELIASLDNHRLEPAAREAILAAKGAAVPALVAHLRRGREAKLDRVVALLGLIGDPRATPALIDELERGRVSQRTVLEAIDGAGDARALIPALSLLGDTDPEVRVAAMAAVGRLIRPGSKALDLVYEALGDKDPRVVALAAEYLGKVRYSKARPRLVSLLQSSKDSGVRASAAGALGWVGDAKAADALVAALDGAEDPLSQAVADALIRIGSKKAAKALRSAASSGAPRKRLTAVFALGGMHASRPSSDSRKVIESVASGSALSPAVAALQALAVFGPKDGLDVLEQAARSASLDRRYAALLSLSRFDGGLRVLRESVRSNRDRVASAAAWALFRRADGGSKQVLESLFRTARGSRRAAAVNASAAIVRHGKKLPHKRLAALLYHPHPLVRANALAGLAGREDAESRATLKKALEQDPSPYVRAAAARGLRGVGVAKKALTSARSNETDVRVLRALRDKPSKVKGKPKWKAFRFVVPSTGEPAARKLYYLLGADGMATALYSDVNGLIVDTAFPGGDYELIPQEGIR